jgi:hypothetical protein
LRAALVLLLVASVAGASSGYTIVAGPNRDAERLGPYRFGTEPTYAAAVKAFGRPTSRSAACVARWSKLGLAVRFGPGCAAWSGATVTSRTWRTAAGLRVGDSLARVHRLYPSARPAATAWLLVYRQGEVGLTVYLRALVHDGRVTALDLPPGNASVSLR